MMEKALQTASATLRGMRNSVQSINRLPPELLAHIFSETQLALPSFLPVPPATDYWHQWLELLEVCRHWRGVIASSPALWSNVCSSANGPAFIRRSHGAELTVYLGVPILGFSPSLMNMLAPHTSRFKELHMRIKASELEDLLKHQFFSSPAPRLNSLLMQVEEREELDGVLPPIFCGHMPKLRQLALGYFTSWPTGYFHNLTSLCLYHQRESSLPTTTEFLDFLEFSPHMEELVLIRGGPMRPSGTDVAPSTGRFVSLKRLQTLDLGDWPSASTISRLLSHLSLPRKTAMYFWGTFTLIRDQEDLGAVLPQDTSRLRNLKGIKEWFFIRTPIAWTNFSPFTFQLVSVVDSTLYMIGDFASSQILPSAISRYQLGRVRSLRLGECIQPRGLRVSDWKSLLGLVPKLQSLVIYATGSPQFTKAVISALRPPKLFPPSLPTLDRVLCPALKAIDIMEDADVPFVHICSVSAQRTVYGAPQINFKFCGTPPPYLPSQVVYPPDSDSEYGFDVFGPGTHIQRVEYIQSEEPELRVAPPTWPTQAFIWSHYNRGYIEETF
jgi:hypothetical protein